MQSDSEDLLPPRCCTKQKQARTGDLLLVRLLSLPCLAAPCHMQHAGVHRQAVMRSVALDRERAV